MDPFREILVELPGLLDGLQPSLSFPDSTLHTADCGIMDNYWKTDGGKAWPDLPLGWKSSSG